MAVSMADITKLRKMTGAGIPDNRWKREDS